MSKTRNMTESDLGYNEDNNHFGHYLVASMGGYKDESFKAVIEHPNWANKEGKGFIEVQLVMNGIEVDGVEWVKMVVDSFDRAVDKKAVQIISDTKRDFLDGLRDRFEVIEDALDDFVEDFELKQSTKEN